MLRRKIKVILATLLGCAVAGQVHAQTFSTLPAFKNDSGLVVGTYVLSQLYGSGIPTSTAGKVNRGEWILQEEKDRVTDLHRDRNLLQSQQEQLLYVQIPIHENWFITPYLSNKDVVYSNYSKDLITLGLNGNTGFQGEEFSFNNESFFTYHGYGLGAGVTMQYNKLTVSVFPEVSLTNRFIDVNIEKGSFYTDSTGSEVSISGKGYFHQYADSLPLIQRPGWRIGFRANYALTQHQILTFYVENIGQVQAFSKQTEFDVNYENFGGWNIDFLNDSNISLTDSISPGISDSYASARINRNSSFGLMHSARVRDHLFQAELRYTNTIHTGYISGQFLYYYPIHESIQTGPVFVYMPRTFTGGISTRFHTKAVELNLMVSGMTNLVNSKSAVNLLGVIGARYRFN